jgi:hypothetical protein
MAIIKANNNTISAITELPTGISGQNYPAFEAYLSSTQSITSNTWTKIQFDTEVFDTNSCYDNTTNYRFTPNVAGKYILTASAYNRCSLSNTLIRTLIKISKNGTQVGVSNFSPNTSSNAVILTPVVSIIQEANGTTDYFEADAFIQVSSGTPEVDGGLDLRSHFNAYRIGD